MSQRYGGRHGGAAEVQTVSIGHSTCVGAGQAHVTAWRTCNLLRSARTASSAVVSSCSCSRTSVACCSDPTSAPRARSATARAYCRKAARSNRYHTEAKHSHVAAALRIRLHLPTWDSDASADLRASSSRSALAAASVQRARRRTASSLSCFTCKDSRSAKCQQRSSQSVEVLCSSTPCSTHSPMLPASPAPATSQQPPQLGAAACRVPLQASQWRVCCPPAALPCC